LPEVFCESSDLEMEAVEVGNMMTVLSNFGGMKMDEENIMDATAVPIVMMASGFFQRSMKSKRLDELKSRPFLASSVISGIGCFVWVGQK